MLHAWAREDRDESSVTAKAVWNGTVLAQSDDTAILDGSHCFPPVSLKPEGNRESDRRSVYFWKGQASCYDAEMADS